MRLAIIKSAVSLNCVKKFFIPPKLQYLTESIKNRSAQVEFEVGICGGP